MACRRRRRRSRSSRPRSCAGSTPAVVPNQAIKVAFDAELSRLYDEWDALGRKVAAGTTGAIEALGHARSVATAERTLPTTPQPVSFRTLTSVVDVTTGDPEQLGRILSGLVASGPEDPVTLDDLRPRLDCAEHWVEHYMPEDAHTRLLAAPDAELLASLDDTDRESVRLLLDGLEQDWSLDGLTSLVYGVPKIQAGLPMDTKPTRGPQGRPAPLLRAALPAARRLRHRPAAPDAAAGGGAGDRCVASWVPDGFGAVVAGRGAGSGGRSAVAQPSRGDSVAPSRIRLTGPASGRAHALVTAGSCRAPRPPR